jgi:hypothetical protein
MTASAAGSTEAKCTKVHRHQLPHHQDVHPTICLEREHALSVDSRKSEQAMCWKCVQIDKEMEHYRGLSTRVSDERSVKCLDILIEKLEGEKKELHIADLDKPAKTAPPR